MKLKLVRTKLTGKPFTKGSLYVDGVFECFTIEDEDRLLELGGKKVQNKTAIPRGFYEVTITPSTRFKKDLPLLINVPGFSGIRIHKGNKSADTEGCIIVGAINSNPYDDFIGGSKTAFDKLFPKMQKALKNKEKITMEII